MIVELLVSMLLLASGILVLTAAAGLWRLRDFFLRLHAAALANTLALWAAAFASAVHLGASTARLALHHWVIVILLAITAPITTMLLARAALFRQRAMEAVTAISGRGTKID
jgi:multicomponent K+:H+ antiporter subunit G